MLAVKKISESAIIPTKGSEYAAGFDLYADSNGEIPVMGREMVPTGISVILPLGTYGRVAPRSGLTWKYGINVGAGVIDPDYTGEVKVILFNHGDAPFIYNKGDRIAQLILEKFDTACYGIVETKDDITSERGAGGFGSTGI